jgi:hypothetical protein
MNPGLRVEPNVALRGNAPASRLRQDRTGAKKLDSQGHGPDQE